MAEFGDVKKIERMYSPSHFSLIPTSLLIVIIITISQLYLLWGHIQCHLHSHTIKTLLFAPTLISMKLGYTIVSQMIRPY